MLAVISPAKSLDFERATPKHTPTQPLFQAQTETAVKAARKLSADDLCALMGISAKLGALNAARFKAFSTPFTKENARAALFAFNGDVYTGLDAYTLASSDLTYAQKHLRIVSGLYGLLRPLDLMQAYRLEMGLPFPIRKFKNLYGYWGDTLTKALAAELATHKTPVLINLASTEYFTAIKPKILGAEVVTPMFKELRGNKAQVISFMAKKARGMMARYMITERADTPEALKDFNADGYRFEPSLSKAGQLIFTRPA
jgi:uncharacterized protein